MHTLQELQLRAALFRALRSFFTNRNFLEVDTPIRHPVILPESHIRPLTVGNQYLQASPEQCMKRLLASGCGDIFQICSCFRREESGSRHLEEFTMLEWYRCNADYRALMRDCEELVGYVCSSLENVVRGEKEGGACLPKLERLAGEWSGVWQRLTVAEAFASWSPEPLTDVLEGDCFDEMLVEHIEPYLGRGKPIFLCDYPASMASLARRKQDNPSVAERFELYIDGVEIANGFSELTDAREQRHRFEKERDLYGELWGERLEMPEKFLDDLERLEPCAGIAFGVDRFFMLLLGKDDIHDAVAVSPRDW